VWIAFEGLDGCGKSTQAAILAGRLGAEITHEPGNTPVGAKIREILLHHPGEISARAEVLLFAADRAEHVERVVEPALRAGRNVVSDRSVWSSVIYQGAGRGIDPEEILQINRWASRGKLPDMVIYMRAKPGPKTDPDRIEAAGEEFYADVERGFEERAAAEGWVIIEGPGSIEEISVEIERRVRERLG